MRLNGLHRLHCEDVKFLRRLVEENEENVQQPDDKEEKPGNLKYNKSPLRKAIEGADMTNKEVADMTNKEVADKVGAHETTVSRILHPEDDDTGRRPSYDLLKRLADVLGGSITKWFPELG